MNTSRLKLRTTSKPVNGILVKRLIINADDYGYSPRFNDGILDAALVTSTTVMIERPFVDLRVMNRGIGVGLHLELKPGNVYDQIEKQFNEFVDVFGGAPTHLDSHKHKHVEGWAIQDVARFAVEHALPARSTNEESRESLRSQGVRTNDWFLDTRRCGIEKTLKQIKELREGVTEWMVHPGYYDEGNASSKNADREKELALCNDGEIKELLKKQGVELASYADAF